MSWLKCSSSLFSILCRQVGVTVAALFGCTAGWLVVLFRSGSKKLCGNYRGISVMDTLAKIQYDTLIRLNRLKLWCNVDKCQAGAQER